MRVGRAGCIVVLLLVTGSACSGGLDPRMGAAPLAFREGFARIDIPLAPREVKPAFGGRWILVYGGVDFGDGGEAFDDGALYDVRRQFWLPVPRAPFAAALWGPEAVWTGTEFVVVGTPCPDPRVDSEDVDFTRCDGEPTAAAFSPANRRWRPVQVPDLGEVTPAGDAPGITALGMVDGAAAFFITPADSDHARRLVTLRPGGAGQIIPEPPAATQVCALDGRLFAVGYRDDAVAPVPGQPGEPTYAWSAPSGAWIDGGGFGPPANGRNGAIGRRATCSPSAISRIGTPGPLLGGLGGAVDWLDAVAGWRSLPPVPAVPNTYEATVAQHGTVPLVWIGDQIALLRNGNWSTHATSGYQRLFPREGPPSQRQSETAPIVGRPPTLAPVGDYLAGPPANRSHDTTSIVFVDPDALAPSPT